MTGYAIATCILNPFVMDVSITLVLHIKLMISPVLVHTAIIIHGQFRCDAFVSVDYAHAHTIITMGAST